MAIITAKGETPYGYMEVTITGEETVQQVKSPDKVIEAFFKKNIKNGKGTMANAYSPKRNTMLQAYAFCTNIFDYRDIIIEGEIGEIENEEGVIY